MCVCLCVCVCVCVCARAHAHMRMCVSVHVWCAYVRMFVHTYVSTFTRNSLTRLTGKLETTPGTWLHARLASLAQTHCVGRHSGPGEQLCVFRSPANMCTYTNNDTVCIGSSSYTICMWETHTVRTYIHNKLYVRTVQ